MLTGEDVRRAAAALEGVALRTPVVRVPALDELAGGPLWLKLESLQRGGSFKLRGASVAIGRRLDRARRTGVVTGSSGNHGTAVAIAARRLGVRAVVVMPEDAPEVKRASVRAEGGEVEICGLSSDQRLARARELSESSGLVMIPPYDDEDVIAGQGTVAMEALQQVPDLEVFLAPCGGGGLLAGCATFLASARPGVEVWGVEAAAADDTRRSFERGERVRIDLPRTIADGMRNVIPGEITFPLVRRHVSGILLVEDAEIESAMARLAWDAKIVAEPTGAAAPAAALSRKIDLRGRTTVAVVSGGNVDPAVLVRALGA